jgi:hypothetical protein
MNARVEPGPDAVSARMAALGLAGAIVLGSLILWIAIPAAWVWGASQLVTRYPIVYAAALLGCPATMVLWGWVLHRLNVVYLRVSGAEQPPPSRSPWLKSLSAERRRYARGSVLEISITVSLIIAVVAMAIWFFFFAHNFGGQLGT